MSDFENDTLTREAVLKRGAGAAAALMLGGAVNPLAAAAAPRVRRANPTTVSLFVNSGVMLGNMGIAFSRDYMRRNKNVKVQIVQSVGTNFFPSQLAAFKANPDKPIINVGFYNASLAGTGQVNDMWESLDYKAMSNAKYIPPSFRRPKSTGIGISTDLVGLEYNERFFSKPPRSWAELWAPEHKGKVVQTNFWWFVVLAAAKLHGGSITNMQPGWDWWKQHPKTVMAIASGANQLNELMSTGAAVISGYLMGNCLSYKFNNKAPINFYPPDEGMLSNPWYLISSKGNTPAQSEVAQDMINEMISKKWSQLWVNQTLTLPASIQVSTPARLRKHPAMSASAKKKIQYFDWEYIGENYLAWQDLWRQNIIL
jgi:putative spermidine/putrescine transport system substrate-binding protein